MNHNTNAKNYISLNKAKDSNNPKKAAANNKNGLFDKLNDLSTKNYKTNTISTQTGKRTNLTGSNKSNGSNCINDRYPRNANQKQSYSNAGKHSSYSSFEKQKQNDKSNSIVNSNSNSNNKQVIDGFLADYGKLVKKDSNNKSSTNSNSNNQNVDFKPLSERESKLLKDKERKEKEERIKAEKTIQEKEDIIKLAKEKKEMEEKIKEEQNELIKSKQVETKKDIKNTLKIEEMKIGKINIIKEIPEPDKQKTAFKNNDNIIDNKEISQTIKTDFNIVTKHDMIAKENNNQIITINTTTSPIITDSTLSSFTSITAVNEISNNTTGLNNLGNTCFMNACLQLIIHSSPFISRLYQYKALIISASSLSMPLTEAFFSLCEETKQSKASISPSSLKSSFGRNHHEYLGHSQHDTQEFCRLFLEDLSKELNVVIKIPQYKEQSTSKKSKVVLNKDYDALFKERENSIVIDTFYGQSVNIFRCSCSFESYSFEKYLDLPLLLNDSEIETQSLDDLLKKHFAKESIQWGEKCESCSMKTLHDKDIRLSYLPDILFISFQRFNSRAKKKNSSRIHFTETLNLFEYVDKDCAGDQLTKYKLIGTSNHSGSINFGHYYAYVKLKNGWYEFNDSRVSKIGSISYSDNTPYILVYQKDDINNS